ncbi:MAG: glutamyl-tRNA reductase [Halodesulfurarchaeum sp.]
MEDVFGLVISHKRAPVDEIETLTERSESAVLSELVEAGAEEAYVLHTCNRAEYYVSGDPSALSVVLDGVDLSDDARSRIRGERVARHLMRVAAGLESMVTGEDEILGQVSDAQEAAIEYLGNGLGTIVEKSIRVGKRVRSETRINEGNPSMGTAAAELAARQLDGLEGKSAIVIGAGEMGRLVAQPLADRGATLHITNRTFESAKDLAERVDANAICYDAIDSRIGSVDLVVTATDAPHPILDPSDFDGASVAVLDLANPRDVAPGVEELDGVEVYDIDDIGAIVDSAVSTRAEAADRAEEIVEEEVDRLKQELKEQRAEEMLSHIYEQAERLRRAEVERATQRLKSNGGLSEHEQEILEDMSSALVNKLLSTPTQSIKEAAVSEDYETLHAVAEVFELSRPEGRPEEPPENRP